MLGKLGQKVTFLEHQARDAVALGAHDERHAALEGGIPATAFGVLGGTAHPKASGLEVVECAGDIGNLRDGQVHDGAGRGLVAAHGYAGCALVGDDDTGRSHNLGGAHDGTKVAVIGHMVEHNDKRGALARAIEDIGNIGVGEVAHLERDALVSTVARQRIELCARHVLNADTRGVEVIDQT